MENELVKWLLQTLPATSSMSPGSMSRASMSLGIGDDAAVYNPDGHRVVVTSDAIIENVHFDDAISLEDVGRKALAVNLSDLAAMAAVPVAAIVNLCIPEHLSLEDVKKLYLGMLPLAEQHQVEIMGGDTNVGSSELIISVTALGNETEQGVLTMSGARAGDRIIVSGSFGGSRHGKHFSFEPRCDLALYLNENYSLTAATDVSDGLSLDLWRVAQASNVGFYIYADRIPLALELTNEVLSDEEERLDQALSDGEDFELILAVPAQAAQDVLDDKRFGSLLTEIGQFTSQREFILKSHDGIEAELTPQGYIH